MFYNFFGFLTELQANWIQILCAGFHIPLVQCFIYVEKFTQSTLFLQMDTFICMVCFIRLENRLSPLRDLRLSQSNRSECGLFLAVFITSTFFLRVRAFLGPFDFSVDNDIYSQCAAACSRSCNVRAVCFFKR